MSQLRSRRVPSTTIDMLLDVAPYDLAASDKAPLFLRCMNEAFAFHFANCPAYMRYCERRGLSESTSFERLEDIPFLPIHAFKDYSHLLTSVPFSEIVRTLRSSATSGTPSIIPVDSITARRQVKALVAVASHVLGPRRLDFLVLDVDPKSTTGGSLGARTAAVRGFLNLAKRAEYLLKESDEGRLHLIEERFLEVLERHSHETQPVVFFGFTYLIYMTLAPLLAAGRRFQLPPGSKVVHIGGWKKLQDVHVDRSVFNAQLSELFGIQPEAVVDFYGFTEQMGITYPDGPGGFKYTPAFSEVLIRDPQTYDVLPDGEVGLLEFISPIPHSYPGIALLTDDLGVIVGRSARGWLGTQFRIIGRAGKAEMRGCGDIMGEKIATTVALNEISMQTPVNVLFEGGVTGSKRVVSADELDQLVDAILSARGKLDKYTVDEIAALIDAAADRWEHDERLADFQHQGLLFLRHWCRSASLRETIQRSIRRPRGVLDSFCSVGDKALLRATSRGLAVHWVAGNVPLLGMLALVQSMLVRNANIIKAPSTFTSVMPLLLDAFRGLHIATQSGRELSGDDLIASIAVVHFDKSNIRASEALSRRADVRIAWGGLDAVEAIVNLPRKYSVEDIVFGPKLSYMVIGREYLNSTRDAKRLARGAATDASVFDQYACASPHTIFVEEGGSEVTPRDFAILLADEMASACMRIPKAPVDAATAMSIASARLKYEFGEELWTSKGTEWSVLYDSEGAKGLAQPCYSRVSTVRVIHDAMQAAEFASRDIQAIGLALKGSRRFAFAERAAELGAERFPEIGRMTPFDDPWDGLFLMDRLVRWVSLGGPN